MITPPHAGYMGSSGREVDLKPTLLVVWSLAALVAGCAFPSDVVEPVGLADGGTGPFPPVAHPPPDFPPRSLPAVVIAAPPPPPITGGTLALSADDRFALAADPDRDLIHVADPTAGTARAIAVPGQPGRAVIDGGRGFVALRTGGAVAVVDLETAALVATWPVCPAPRGLAIGADVLHVACAGGWLIDLDLATGAERSRIALAPDLRDVLVDGELLHVSRFRAAELWTLDASGAVLAVRRPALRDGPARVAWRLAPGRGGSVLMLHQVAGSTVVFEEAPGGYGPNPVGCGAISATGVTAFPSLHGAPATIVVASVTLGVDLVAHRRDVVIAAPGNAAPETDARFTALVAAPAPQPLPFDAESDRPQRADCDGGQPPALPVAREMLTAVARRADGDLLALRRDPPALVDATGAVVVALEGASVADTGHELFHTNAGPGIACASCHPEAGDDGHTWTFDATGPRRAQELRGGIGETAPFHRAQELGDMTALLAAVMRQRMGGPALGWGYANRVRDWLDAQPIERVEAIPSGPGDPGRGERLFHGAADCARCHAGPRLSDGQLHDIGRGVPLETPTLLGVGRRAPLMHDGCAATLRDRFDPDCGGAEHGATAALTAAEIDDLVAWLETL